MNVYILGLENDFRGKLLVDHFNGLGVHPEIVFGIDARSSNEFVIEKMANPKRIKRIMGREITSAEAAVVLGHRMIYEKFLETGAPWALVLEDDSFPTPYFNLDNIALNDVMSPMIVHLGGIENLVKYYGNTTCLFLNVLDLSNAKTGFYVHGTLGNLFGTYAYLINRKAAEIAMQNFDAVDSTADWPYAWRSKVNYFLPEKCFFDVSLEGSLVNEGREEMYSASKQLSLLRRNRTVMRLENLFGLLGLLSIHSVFQGLNFGQHYSERYLYPFLLRRVNSIERNN